MSEEQAKQFLDQATQSLQSGQFQQALELIEQSIALKETSEAQVLRGIALSQTGQPGTATEAFRRALMLDPHSAKAYYNLAVHLYSQGQKNEALEMAREAVRSDSQHAGARDLISRIEAESGPTQDVVAPRVEDPLKPGETSPQTERPPVTGPSAPYQQPTQGYYRPGYESGGVHSLQFIANMGKTWDGVGFAIVAVSLLISLFGLFQLFTLWPEIQRAMGDPQAAQAFQNRMYAGNALGTILQFVGYAATLGGLTWMIMDLSDRRGNWLWLLPYILVCCCTCTLLQPVVQIIYMTMGRQK